MVKLMEKGPNIDVACSLCVRVARRRFLKLNVRWNGGREKVRLTVCEESSIERLTKRCSKSLSQRSHGPRFSGSFVMTFNAGIWERIGEQPRLKGNVWFLLWMGKSGQMFSCSATAA